MRVKSGGEVVGFLLRNIERDFENGREHAQVIEEIPHS